MKISISVPDSSMVLLDRVVELKGLGSRSVAIQQAIELLVIDSLVADYRSAFEDSEYSDESSAWDALAGEGLPPEKPWW
jgi:Arc/MetJ-type ribon-helix-helix transcriptional regulator